MRVLPRKLGPASGLWGKSQGFDVSVPESTGSVPNK